MQRNGCTELRRFDVLITPTAEQQFSTEGSLACPDGSLSVVICPRLQGQSGNGGNTARWSKHRRGSSFAAIARLHRGAGGAHIREALAEDGSDEDHRLVVIRQLHAKLFFALHAADERVGKAYDLGRALADTCRIPRDAGDTQRVFAPQRVRVIDAWLRELTSALPVHTSRVVRISLAHWQEWVHLPAVIEAESLPHATEGEVAQRLRVQGGLWRTLLTGDTAAVDMLERHG